MAAVLAVDRQHVYRLQGKYGEAHAEPRTSRDAVTITVEPRRCVERLEVEALRRKQQTGCRVAKSPIVVGLIERAMSAED